MMEYWLRGPVPGIPDLLQPVAHALLQARDEILEYMKDFPETLLWKRPAGVASPAFHLQHLAGVLDRLFSYAEGQQLTVLQLDYLKAEGIEDPAISLSTLLAHFTTQVEKSVEQLRKTRPESLTAPRGVGRKQVPSTQLGLLFHAAEHTMRHNGQLLVTCRILLSN